LRAHGNSQQQGAENINVDFHLHEATFRRLVKISSQMASEVNRGLEAGALTFALSNT